MDIKIHKLSQTIQGMGEGKEPLARGISKRTDIDSGNVLRNRFFLPIFQRESSMVVSDTEVS